MRIAIQNANDDHRYDTRQGAYDTDHNAEQRLFTCSE